MRQFALFTLIIGGVSAALWGLPHNIQGVNKDAFEVGVLACLSGECAEWGANTVKGLELAAKQINAEGGVLGRTIVLRVQDTKEATGGSSAVSAYRSLASTRSLKFFVGPTWTPGGLALAPILAKQKGVLAISPSLGVAEFNEASANLFNTWPHDSFATQKLARFAHSQGMRSAAILSSTQPWEKKQGDSFEDEFKRLGGRVLLKSEPNPGTDDYQTISFRVKKQNPDFVFLANFNDMATSAKALEKVGFKKPKLCILMDQTRVKAANGALEGAIFASYPHAKQDFREQYEAEYGEKPGISADTSYDTLKLYVEAIKQVGTFEAEKVAQSLTTITLSGASGEITFDRDGGVVKDPLLFQISGNSWNVLDEPR